MAEHGIRDFLIAKRKAAERMGVADMAAVLPRNVEIEQALAEYQRLFGGEALPVSKNFIHPLLGGKR